MEDNKFKYKTNDLLLPTFEIIQKYDGEIGNWELEKLVIKKLEIEKSQLLIMHTANRSVFQYRMAWARTELKHAGLIVNVKRSVWACTTNGKQLYDFDKDILIQLSRQGRFAKSNMKTRNIIFNKFVIENKGNTILDIHLYKKQQVVCKTCYTILISENGAGKSFILSKISEVLNAYFSFLKKQKDHNLLKYDMYMLEYNLNKDIIILKFDKGGWTLALNGRNLTSMQLDYLPNSVIALTHTLGDKFPISDLTSKDRDFGYYYLGPKSSEKNIILTDRNVNIINSIIKLFYKNNIFYIHNILQYIGYESYVHINFPSEVMKNYLEKYKNYKFDKNAAINKIRNIDMNNDLLGYTLLAQSEKDLFDKNTLARCSNELQLFLDSCEQNSCDEIEIYFKKNGELIKYEWLSSGESVMINSLLSLSAYINAETLILIDEPENSLHPRWQNEFIPLINRFFKDSPYSFHSIIATHSPNIVLQINDDNSTIIKITSTEGKRSYHIDSNHSDTQTIEKVLYDIFGISEQRSYYVIEDMSLIIDYIQDSKPLDTLYNEALERIRILSSNLSNKDFLLEFYNKVKLYEN